MRYLQELRQLLGNRVFMAVVVIGVVSAEWHSLVSNIAIVFSTLTARENARQAPGRELALREGAEADAVIKRQTALQAEREAKARADEQEARACQARMEAELKYKPLQDVQIPDCARLYSTPFGNPVTDSIMQHSRQCVDRVRAFMAQAPDTESAYRAFVRERGSEFEAIKKDCNGSVMEADAKRIAAIVGAKQDHLKPDAGGEACFEKRLIADFGG